MKSNGSKFGRPRSPDLARASVLGLMLTSGALSGCGNTLYALRANAATSRLEEARELGAEELAPYEYYSAKEHLDKAQTEAAEADYGDAVGLASDAEDFAEKAIRIARDAHRGAGR